VSGKPILLKEGRFGLYVTDGETNATLRREDDPGSMTVERAQELLQLRREAGPGKKKVARKTAGKAVTKKATKKAATPAEGAAAPVKKAASKKTAKKAAAPGTSASAPKKKSAKKVTKQAAARKTST
jgi:DNA topoisomerase-1